jgi:hypothetical protein
VLADPPSTQANFFGNSSEGLMYWMSVSPLLPLPTLNLDMLKKISLKCML